MCVPQFSVPMCRLAISMASKPFVIVKARNSCFCHPVGHIQVRYVGFRMLKEKESRVAPWCSPFERDGCPSL
ncbi:unnamed protein product [Urochloa humidicola]